MNLIPREAWGARPPAYPVTMVTRKDLFIAHHSGAAGWWPTEAQEIAAMQFWQLYHQNIGGADIYYGAVIFPSGRAYEGRYGGLLANNGGAYSCCKRGFGVCLAGNFTHALPTPAALNTLKSIAKETYAVLNIQVNRYWGHRDCCQYDSRNCGNECPGEALYWWLPSLRNHLDQPDGEEEEDMFVPLKLVNEAPDLYIYALTPVFEDTSIAFYADVPNNYDVKVYIHPIAAQDSYGPKEYGCGGYENDEVKGAANVVGNLYSFNGAASMVIHSPYRLVGGVW